MLPDDMPPQITPLIGRETELAAIKQLLGSAAVRLVTLTGLGGVGKTRIALHLIEQLKQDGAGDVWVISLAPVRAPDLVLPAIMQGLSLPEQSDQPPLSRIQAMLQDRQALVLLDNFEQVVEAAPLLPRLLAAVPGLRLLVTSRKALRVIGEHEYPIGPLSRGAAIALFSARLQAVRPEFALTPESSSAVEEICARLDRLPLALELAAARGKLLSPQMIVSRLNARLALLTGNVQEAPDRHRTLRHMLDWSYELLQHSEQRLLMRLGVFVADYGIEAAEAICALPQESESVMDGLAALLDNSLIYRKELPDGAVRIGMLETIREYALERLASQGELETLQRRHADYYAGLAETLERSLMVNHEQPWLERLQQEHSNMQLAIGWALSAGEPEPALRLAGSLWKFWRIRGYLSEGRRWVEAALAQPGAQHSGARARALWAAGWLAALDSTSAEGHAFFAESLALAQQLGDTRSAGLALHGLAQVARESGDYALAASLLEQSLPLFAALGDIEHVAWSKKNLASLALDQHDYARALPLLEQGLQLFQQLGQRWAIAEMMRSLGSVFHDQGNYERALTLYQAGLAIYREIGDQRDLALLRAHELLAVLERGDPQGLRSLLEQPEADGGEAPPDSLAWGMQCLAELLNLRDWPVRAARLLGAAEALRQARGLQSPPEDQLLLAQLRQQLGERLGAAPAQSHWDEGRTAIEHALAISRAPDQATPSLTARELQVLRLLVQGRSYAEIAETLVISPHTVNAHLTSIFAKLGVHSRHEATRLALSQGLI